MEEIRKRNPWDEGGTFNLILNREEVERILTAFYICAAENMYTKGDKRLVDYLTDKIGITDEWASDMVELNHQMAQELAQR